MINRLVLRSFRNYSAVDIAVGHPVNVFVGRNGQGKTNLLEAVYFAGMLRSFRTSRIADLRKIGENRFYVGAEIAAGARWNKFIEVEYGAGRKLKIDGSPVFKASEFIRQIKTVAFSPDDIGIVAGNSGLRRRFVDILISVEEPLYLSALNDYMMALKSRNAVLRSPNADLSVLKAFEPILARNGCIVAEKRMEYILKLTQEVRNLLSGFSKADFEIRYKVQAGAENYEEYMERFEKERKKDIFKGMTGFGPQLDEFDLIFNSKLLRNFGSTGQCRLVSLCLKMAKINILSENNNGKDKIVALVDDVTGELDLKTKELFFKIINKAEQTFFTFTELPDDKFFDSAKIFKVENANVDCK